MAVHIRSAQFHRFSVAFVSVYRARGPIISIAVKRLALCRRVFMTVPLPTCPRARARKVPSVPRCRCRRPTEKERESARISLFLLKQLLFIVRARARARSLRK